jgi:hypothetical protein
MRYYLFCMSKSGTFVAWNPFPVDVRAGLCVVVIITAIIIIITITSSSSTRTIIIVDTY